MKLRIPILLILLLFAAAKAGAQGVEQNNSTATDSTKAAATSTDTTKKESKSLFKQYDRPRIKMGLRGGVNFSDMIYSHEPIGRYDHTKKIAGLIGIFAEMPIGRTPLSIRPEVSFTARGTELKWLDVKYDFMANYVDLRLPLTWNFNLFGERFSPYLMAAPQLNIPYGGVISYSAEDFPSTVSTPISKADIMDKNLSVTFGGGIDFRIDLDMLPIYVSLEAGYNMGLWNTFAEREKIETTENPSNILNNFFGAELWHESRKTRGVEVAMRLSVPLDGKFIRRYQERRKIIPDTVLRIQRDTIIGPNDTIIIETVVPDTKRKLSTEGEYQAKECFTIAEINEMLDNGQNITGKRICMFDINFDFDSYKIRKESEAPLNQLVKMMQDYPQMTVEVYGHTDSIGTDEYNQRLSENRASSVVEYLKSHGISPSRVKSFGYGLRYPIDTNSTEAGRFRNRRVEFDVITIGLKRKYED